MQAWRNNDIALLAIVSGRKPDIVEGL